MPEPSSRTRRMPSMRRMVSARETTASPSRAQRSARGSASTPTLLHRKPEAPARSVMSPTSSLSEEVSITTRTSGACSTIWRVAATPSMPGMTRSMTTTSGL